ncbi:MAG: hypothetical protein GX119_10785 [Syntrophomonadaceae bacterium]|nr:hypothetical protein [Syntrophomonadaceae bacterium]
MKNVYPDLTSVHNRQIIVGAFFDPISGIVQNVHASLFLLIMRVVN